MQNSDPITGASDEMCDSFIEHANKLGLSREQMVVVCGTLFANHAVVTGVSRERAHLLVETFWDWRERRTPSDKLLVKASSAR